MEKGASWQLWQAQEEGRGSEHVAIVWERTESVQDEWLSRRSMYGKIRKFEVYFMRYIISELLIVFRCGV